MSGRTQGHLLVVAVVAISAAWGLAFGAGIYATLRAWERRRA